MGGGASAGRSRFLSRFTCALTFSAAYWLRYHCPAAGEPCHARDRRPRLVHPYGRLPHDPADPRAWLRPPGLRRSALQPRRRLRRWLQGRPAAGGAVSRLVPPVDGRSGEPAHARRLVLGPDRSAMGREFQCLLEDLGLHWWETII